MADCTDFRAARANVPEHIVFGKGDGYKDVLKRFKNVFHGVLQ